MPWNYRETLAPAAIRWSGRMAEKHSIRPCRIRSSEMAAKRASKTAKSKRVFGQRTESGENVSRWPLCARFHARSADSAVADSRYARVCRQAGLDDRGADERGRFRRGRTRSSAKICWKRRAAGRSMSCWCGDWIVGAGQSRIWWYTAGTGGSRRRLRVADRSTGSDNAGRPRDGRTAVSFRRVRTRNPARAHPRRTRRSTAERQRIWVGPPPRRRKPARSGSFTVPASAKPKSPAASKSAAPPCAASWLTYSWQKYVRREACKLVCGGLPYANARSEPRSTVANRDRTNHGCFGSATATKIESSNRTITANTTASSSC